MNLEWPQFYDKKDMEHVDQQPETYRDSDTWTDDPMHCTHMPVGPGAPKQCQDHLYPPELLSFQEGGSWGRLELVEKILTRFQKLGFNCENLLFA